MIHYDENVAVVKEAMRLSGYSQKILDLCDDCFNSLKKRLQYWGSRSIPWKKAQNWCSSPGVNNENRIIYRSFIKLLEDVYELGVCRESHLCFNCCYAYSQLMSIAENYLAFAKANNSYSGYCFIKISCYRFIGYLTKKGMDTFDKITLPFLMNYAIECRCFKNDNYTISLCYLEEFFFYLADAGIIPYEYGWFMHYAKENDKPIIPCVKPSGSIMVSKGPDNSFVSVQEYPFKMLLFLDAVKKYQYSQIMYDKDKSILMLLYLFLVSNGVNYTFETSQLWFRNMDGLRSRNNLQECKKALELFEEFIVSGKLSPEICGLKFATTMDSLPDWCRSVLIDFLKQKEREGNKESTVSMYQCSITKFCEFLVKKKLNSFLEVTPEIVKEFNLQDVHSTAEGKNAYNGRIRKFLMYLYREQLNHNFNLYLALPKGTAPKERVVTVLNAEEIEQVNEYKKNASTPVELRDAAMLEISMKMGFRGVDIANLKLSDIDLKSKSIRIIQEKTNVEIWQPMPASVGNAILKYIKHGRNNSIKDDHLFLTVRAPFKSSASRICADVVKRSLPNRQAKTGFHITRRTFATNILRNGGHVSNVADALGHSDHENVHKYLSLDEERMLLCPLSLSELNLLPKRRTFDD